MKMRLSLALIALTAANVSMNANAAPSARGGGERSGRVNAPADGREGTPERAGTLTRERADQVISRLQQVGAFSGTAADISSTQDKFRVAVMRSPHLARLAVKMEANANESTHGLADIRPILVDILTRPATEALLAEHAALQARVQANPALESDAHYQAVLTGASLISEAFAKADLSRAQDTATGRIEAPEQQLVLKRYAEACSQVFLADANIAPDRLFSAVQAKYREGNFTYSGRKIEVDPERLREKCKPGV